MPAMSSVNLTTRLSRPRALRRNSCRAISWTVGRNPLVSSSTATATRGLLATDHVILNHGQVTWTTPELAPPSPNYHTTPTGGRFSSRQI
ncbi:hypothetical protein TNCV_1086381 [Trichonephila clavipes]|nr:hypothetical protein TNCV_1086381 [Trichonephila clavipes]